jgi:hypothetical protein
MLNDCEGFFGTGKAVVKNKSNVFSLGDRLSVLTNADHTVIIPHIADEKNEVLRFMPIYHNLIMSLEIPV